MRAKTLKEDTNESGAFLVLAVLVMSVLFGFIALAIDTARTLNSSSEKISTADAVALAALDVYLNKEPPGAPASQLVRHKYKWDQVLGQVVTYANSNQTTFIGGSQTITTADINTAGRGVEVKPGRWWMSKPMTCSGGAPSCPCTDIAAPLYRPCFQECDIATGCVNPGGVGELFASAIKVKLSSVGQGGVKTLFARVLGVDKIDVEGKAYSAAIGSVSYSLPQIGVLLFDLSRSQTMDNYLPFERSPVSTPGLTERQEYSFPLSAAPAAGCAASGTPSTCGLNCPVSGIDSNRYLTEYKTPAYASKYNKYTCYSGTLGGFLERHLVNTQAGTAPPEPYSTLLAAANSYLTQFKTLGRAGDKLLVLGFDSVDLPERHYPPGNVAGPIFIDPTDPYLDQLILMTSSRSEAAKKMFFPRANSKLDLSKALKTAADLILKAYPTTKIDPYIALFSNGFSMCGTRNPAGFSNYCAELTPLPTAANRVLRVTNFNKQITSLDEALVDMGESFLKPNRIKVHVVSGNASMPPGRSTIPTHTPLIGHWSNNRCAQDMELRKKRYLNVLPYPPGNVAPTRFNDRMVDEFSNLGMTTASPLPSLAVASLPAFPNGIRYVQPSLYLYSLAATTLGYYVPLRPQCTFPAAIADGYCASPNKLSVAGIVPTTSNRIIATRTLAYKPALGTMEIDSEGRMFCEPLNGVNSQLPALLGNFANNVTQSRLIVLAMPD